jgi:hypothetical protein
VLGLLGLDSFRRGWLSFDVVPEMRLTILKILILTQILVANAADPKDWPDKTLRESWELWWKEAGLSDRLPPKPEPIAEKWANEGVVPKLTGYYGSLQYTLTFQRNGKVFMSRDDGFKSKGTWRLSNGKLVAFLDHASLPEIIFLAEGRFWSLDPFSTVKLQTNKRHNKAREDKRGGD